MSDINIDVVNVFCGIFPLINSFMKVEVVVVDPVPLPADLNNSINTDYLRAITTTRMVWLF